MKVAVQSHYLPINHVGDHHDLVRLRIRKLQGEFGGFDVEGEDNGILSKAKHMKTDSKAECKAILIRLSKPSAGAVGEPAPLGNHVPNSTALPKPRAKTCPMNTTV